MKILLTNDDGYLAIGIRTLYAKLIQKHEVVVVAPENNRSACSHALTLDRPLRPCYCADGFIYLMGSTPTDCVHVALTGLLDFEPDIVVSGINAGANLGDDTLYSGTVAAAMEGRFLNLPSVAISAIEPFNFDRAAAVADEIIDRIEQTLPAAKVVFNVNVPSTEHPYKGIKVVPLGKRVKADDVIKSQDPQGRDVFWIGSSGNPDQDISGTDFEAVEMGYASLTPLGFDLTNHSMLENLAHGFK